MSERIPVDTLQAARCEQVATRQPHPPHLFKTTSASGWLYDAQCPGVATCGASSPHEPHDAAFANPGEASHCEGWPPNSAQATFRFPRAVTPPELGWTIDFGYLSKLQGDIPGDDENHGADVSLETIEAVLLAVERNYDPRDHE